MHFEITFVFYCIRYRKKTDVLYWKWTFMFVIIYRSHLITNIENVCVCVCSTYLSSYVMFSPVACSKVTLFRPNTLQYKVQSSNVHILVLLAVSVHSAADGCLLIPLPQPVFSYSMTLSHGLVENWSKHHWFSVPNESRSSLEVTNDLSSPSRPTNYVEYTSSWGLSSKFPARCRI